jgi:hypothetical protein
MADGAGMSDEKAVEGLDPAGPLPAYTLQPFMIRVVAVTLGQGADLQPQVCIAIDVKGGPSLSLLIGSSEARTMSGKLLDSAAQVDFAGRTPAGSA